MKHILEFNGSLLTKNQFIVAPYDCEKKGIVDSLEPLDIKSIKNYSKKPFSIDYRNEKRLCIINGMGVTLGDSIIGLSCLDLIKKINPDISIEIIRPETSNSYVDEIYNLSSFIVNHIEKMPYPLRKIDHSILNIDIGNQLYWKDFNTLEMHDFFFKNLGVDYTSLIIKKQNTFLQRIIPNFNKTKKFGALFCPYASTKLRSIPDKYHEGIVKKIIKQTGLKVFGFSKIETPGYQYIGDQAKNTFDYISIISRSSYVYTVDSSALHIAAGFEIPTFCIFTSIKPNLRSKYYPNCINQYIGFKEIENIHQTSDKKILKLVEAAYEDFFKNKIFK